MKIAQREWNSFAVVLVVVALETLAFYPFLSIPSEMDQNQAPNLADGKVDGGEATLKRRESFVSENSQTASEYVKC